ncbi:MAG TPA: cation:proton antiporter [Ignavibacteria bacterium]|jgi:Kef-type K+ transport system membrane component KefB
MNNRRLFFLIFFVLIFISIALSLDSNSLANNSHSDPTSHADPVVPVLTHFSIILIAAKLGAEIFERFKQPAVLGELIFGILIGNAGLLIPGYNFFDALRVENITENWAIVIDSIARIGVILLLFEVGLESTFADMKRVGKSSFFVATIGVIAPFILGFLVSMIFITKVPDAILKISPNFDIINIHIFVGAILCATSVGITARVFQDMGLSQTKESRIIIGAAVIDDVLGILILAIVSNMVIAAETGIGFDALQIIKIAIIAIVFLALSIFIGLKYVPSLFNLFSKMRTQGIMLISSLIFCFALSIFANIAGLATIIGAYAAGLILEEVHFKGFNDATHLEEYLKPITSIFVPVFFIQMGIQVRLEAFMNLSIIGIALGLTLAAFAGKQLCSFGVFEKGVNKLSVGLGMTPRGEVGLIFAGIGKSLGVIDDAIFSAAVIMVIITTIITPPLLKMSLSSKINKG